VIELPDEGEASGAPLPEHKPVDTSLRREDFDSTEAYLKAEKADQIARGLATRKKNREAKPKVMAGHIRAIAEARKAHPTLSLRKFSQFLFDEGVYKSYGWDAQKAKPVNSAILPVWLKQAREAGLLPQKALPKRTPKTPKVTYPRKPDPRP